MIDIVDKLELLLNEKMSSKELDDALKNLRPIPHKQGESSKEEEHINKLNRERKKQRELVRARYEGTNISSKSKEILKANLNHAKDFLGGKLKHIFFGGAGFK